MILALILKNIPVLILISLVSMTFAKIFSRNFKKTMIFLAKYLILTIPMLLILWTIFSGFDNAIIATIKFSSLSVVSFAMISCFQVYESFKLLSNIFPYKFAFIIILCVRYMEAIKEDAGRIDLIRKARGFEDKESFVKKIRSKMELIVPVFVDSLLKAEDIACALDTRCFGIYKKRTFWKP
ncbi:MAG: energy-coupling factor transporter transmembrane component T [Candidatus Aenigmarchaeota archaeon]|nr:energy-coupling factor transporter transmembrane component T [Candidatus Aenigmarchaeota archaeon]